MRVVKKESVTWSGVPEMMANKAIRDGSLSRIHPDGRRTVFLSDGREIPFAEFDLLYPLKLKYIEPKGENICKKTDFIFK